MIYLPVTALFSILGLTLIIYFPGLNGPFLLDDFGPVAALDKYGGIHDWETFRLFVFGDHISPLGRPVSLLSFLLDGVSFTDPWRFKFTNLMLHLLNGVLLCRLVMVLESMRTGGRHKQRIFWVGILVAGVWLLHPFNVSTTLYVVQRMAQLSSLFVLAGLLGYLSGRRLLGTAPWWGYLVMSISIIAGTGLAVMSKENGCLLPLFILVLESTVLSGIDVSPDPRWRRLFLVTPVALIIAYIVYYIASGQFHEAYGLRTFTWTERLLTEARILWDYLGSWFFPAGMSRGVYADDYLPSTGLFYPVQTFYAVIGLFLLVFVAVYRKVWPTLRLAVLFFLVGHLLESTILPLELYFEHRNYLPAMFLFYPLVLMIEHMVQSRKLRYLVGGLFIIIPATVTAQRASLWGDEYALAEASVAHYPYSQRANRFLAHTLGKKGRPELAVQRLLDAEERLSDNIPIKMHLLTLYCGFGLDVQDRFSALVNLIRVSDYDFRTYKLLKSVVMMVHEQSCVGLSPASAHVFLDNLDLNPGIRGRNGPMRQIYHLRGVLYAEENKGGSALAAFVRAQDYYPDVDAGLLEVAVLATNEHYAEAMILLDKAEAILQKKGERIIWQTSLDYPGEITRLRDIIRQDAGKK